MSIILTLEEWVGIDSSNTRGHIRALVIVVRLAQVGCGPQLSFGVEIASANKVHLSGLNKSSLIFLNSTK